MTCDCHSEYRRYAVNVGSYVRLLEHQNAALWVLLVLIARRR